MTDFQSHTFILNQASEVSRNRGASLLARPGHSLIAAIRSQHQHESLPLGMYPKSLHLQQPNCCPYREPFQQPCIFFLLFFSFESDSHCVHLAFLALTVQTRLSKNKQDSPDCPVHQHAWPPLFHDTSQLFTLFLLISISSFSRSSRLSSLFIQQSVKFRNTGFKRNN